LCCRAYEDSRSTYVGETWQDDIDYLKSWMADRIAWLDAELGGACQR
jgi:hypothetical protein